jgi:hypothetical protein
MAPCPVLSVSPFRGTDGPDALVEIRSRRLLANEVRSRPPGGAPANPAIFENFVRDTIATLYLCPSETRTRKEWDYGRVSQWDQYANSGKF